MDSYLGSTPGTTRPVERCLPRDGPGLFNVGLDLPWATLEGPWALQHGAPTIDLCRDRGVSFLADTQAWRYHDPRTFLVEKFTTTPYAPAGPLVASDRSALHRFVESDLETQASLGASAYLLPGVIPTNSRDDIHALTLTLLETAQAALPDARPCVLRAAGIAGADAGLGEGESFAYGAKIKNHEPRNRTEHQPRPLGGRLYVPHLGRSVSAREWDRLMQVPTLRGQLLCRLPCCAFRLPVETTPRRGREHSLHCRVAEAKVLPGSGRSTIDAAIALLEQRQSTARTIATGLDEAGLDPVATGFLDNHLAVAHFLRLRDASSAAA